MPLRDIRKLIGTSSELETVRNQARRLAVLQQAYVDYTPVEFANLTKASRVGYIKAGTLYLVAEQSAVAAKLRQLLPRLLPIFRNLDGEVTGIKVALQVNYTQQNPADRIKKSSLPVDSIYKFEALSKKIRDPDLKSAIAKLVNSRIKANR